MVDAWFKGIQGHRRCAERTQTHQYRCARRIRADGHRNRGRLGLRIDQEVGPVVDCDAANDGLLPGQNEADFMAPKREIFQYGRRLLGPFLAINKNGGALRPFDVLSFVI